MSACDGGPAFPMPIAGCNDGSVYNTLEQSSGKLGGMSLRAYLAGQAIAGTATPGYTTPDHVELVALCAIAIADAIIKQLEAKP